MIKSAYYILLESFCDICAVVKERIAGRACRFVYDNIVDRDLIVLADDLESLPEPPKHSQKNSEERAADAIQKMSNLLGKSESSFFRHSLIWVSADVQFFSVSHCLVVGTLSVEYL